MSETPTPIKAHPEPELYEIRVRGHLAGALHGLLKKVRDLGLSLLSVNQVPPLEPTNQP